MPTSAFHEPVSRSTGARRATTRDLDDANGLDYQTMDRPSEFPVSPLVPLRRTGGSRPAGGLLSSGTGTNLAQLERFAPNAATVSTGQHSGALIRREWPDAGTDTGEYGPARRLIDVLRRRAAEKGPQSGERPEPGGVRLARLDVLRKVGLRGNPGDLAGEDETLHGPSVSGDWSGRDGGAGRVGGGGGLPDAVRGAMERSFGTDFSEVRVYQKGDAEGIGAFAFTRGSDLHFARGAFDPHNEAGRRLLGHELAHVVQQREVRVAPTEAEGGPINTDISLEQKAVELGDRAARGEVVGHSIAPATGGTVMQAMFMVMESYKSLRSVAVTKAGTKPTTVGLAKGTIFVCTGEDNNGDYKIASLTGDKYIVDASDADPTNFVAYELRKGERGYLPQLGRLEQHPLFTERDGAAARKTTPAKKKQAFFSVKKGRVPALGQPGQEFDPRLISADSMGTERIALLNGAHKLGQLMVRTKLSELTGLEVQQIYCVDQYTLQWREIGSLDSDHVVAQTDIVKWRENLARIVTNDTLAQKRLKKKKVKGTGYQFDDFFLKDKSGGYVANQQGAQALHTNTRNLVFADKVVNQTAKNDEQYDRFLRKSVALGDDFLDTLPGNDPNELFCEDGTTVGERIKEFNNQHENKEAIDRNLKVTDDLISRTDRSVKILKDQKKSKRKRLSNPMGSKRAAERASKRQKKEHLVHTVLESVNTEVDSEDDDYVDEKQEFVSSGMPFYMQQIGKGRTHDLESEIERLDQLTVSHAKLQKESKKKDRRIAELEKQLRAAKKAKPKPKATTKTGPKGGVGKTI